MSFKFCYLFNYYFLKCLHVKFRPKLACYLVSAGICIVYSPPTLHKNKHGSEPRGQRFQRQMSKWVESKTKAMLEIEASKCSRGPLFCLKLFTTESFACFSFSFSSSLNFPILFFWKNFSPSKRRQCVKYMQVGRGVGEMESRVKWKEKMADIATATFMRSCDVIEGGALRHIVISRAKLVNIVEQSRVLCEDYIYCRLQVANIMHIVLCC